MYQIYKKNFYKCNSQGIPYLGYLRAALRDWEEKSSQHPTWVKGYT